jgi:hypothetical protein
MSWVFDAWGPSATVEEIVGSTGAIVMGRRTYQVEDRDRPGIYGGMSSGALFVVTHTPATVPDWMTGTFVDGVGDAVAQAGPRRGSAKSACSAPVSPGSARKPGCSRKSWCRWRP